MQDAWLWSHTMRSWPFWLCLIPGVISCPTPFTSHQDPLRLFSLPFISFCHSAKCSGLALVFNQKHKALGTHRHMLVLLTVEG